MGLLDYYRQFAGMSDEEVSEHLREQAQERRRRALARIDVLDLSRTTWHELPHPEVVNAVTYGLRGALNVQPDPTAEELRRELGRRNGVEPERVVVGHGAAQLLAAAARALLGADEELLTPWPSYGLYPLMAQRAGARAVPLPDGHDVERLLAAVTPATRAIALCNPNDPTGAHLPSAALRELLDALPEHVSLLLDEALADFVAADGPAGASTPALLDDHPRLLIFRTFSKVYGLAGLRCGYALCGDERFRVAVEQVRQPFFCNALAQAAAEEALRHQDEVTKRVEQTIAERIGLEEELRAIGLQVAGAQANFLWHSLGGNGAVGPEREQEILDGLAERKVLIRSGDALGRTGWARTTIGTPAENRRFLDALRELV
jgi:histidinol-phosphate aminotransferase